jgi:hypothetical protein
MIDSHGTSAETEHQGPLIPPRVSHNDTGAETEEAESDTQTRKAEQKARLRFDLEGRKASVCWTYH